MGRFDPHFPDDDWRLDERPEEEAEMAQLLIDRVAEKGSVLPEVVGVAVAPETLARLRLQAEFPTRFVECPSCRGGSCGYCGLTGKVTRRGAEQWHEEQEVAA